MQVVSVSIGGKNYRITTQESVAHVQAAAQFLSAAVGEISGKMPTATSEQVLLLASLQALVTCIRAHEEQNAVAGQVVDRILAVLSPAK